MGITFKRNHLVPSFNLPECKVQQCQQITTLYTMLIMDSSLYSIDSRIDVFAAFELSKRFQEPQRTTFHLVQCF